MTWLQRYRIRSFVGSSVWPPPLLGMAAALLLFPVIRRVDAILGVEPWFGPDGARTLLGALAASMLTFIVFVFSILLLSVQLASARLAPWIISLAHRSLVVRLCLTFLVFAFTFTLAVLCRIEDTVPQVSVWVAACSSVLCIGVFIYRIDNVVRSLRPVSILTRVGAAGQEVIREVYPHLLAESPDPEDRTLATSADSLGVGGVTSARPRVPERR